MIFATVSLEVELNAYVAHPANIIALNQDAIFFVHRLFRASASLTPAVAERYPPRTGRPKALGGAGQRLTWTKKPRTNGPPANRAVLGVCSPLTRAKYAREESRAL